MHGYEALIRKVRAKSCLPCEKQHRHESLLLGGWLGRANLDQRSITQRLSEELDDAVAHHAIDLWYNRGNTAHIDGGDGGSLPGDTAVHRQIRQPVSVTVLFAQHVPDFEVVELIKHLRGPDVQLLQCGT